MLQYPLHCFEYILYDINSSLEVFGLLNDDCLPSQIYFDMFPDNVSIRCIVGLATSRACATGSPKKAEMSWLSKYLGGQQGGHAPTGAETVCKSMIILQCIFWLNLERLHFSVKEISDNKH